MFHFSGGVAAGSEREVPMVTRYFEQPVPVQYRTGAGWRSVLALGVRRLDDKCWVLITAPLGDSNASSWVPRSRVRPADAAAEPGSPNGLGVERPATLA